MGSILARIAAGKLKQIADGLTTSRTRSSLWSGQILGMCANPKGSDSEIVRLLKLATDDLALARTHQMLAQERLDAVCATLDRRKGK